VKNRKRERFGGTQMWGSILYTLMYVLLIIVTIYICLEGVAIHKLTKKTFESKWIYLLQPSRQSLKKLQSLNKYKQEQIIKRIVGMYISRIVLVVLTIAVVLYDTMILNNNSRLILSIALLITIFNIFNWFFVTNKIKKTIG